MKKSPVTKFLSNIKIPTLFDYIEHKKIRKNASLKDINTNESLQ